VSLSTKVLATIREHRLVRAEDRVAVAISGGADSVALAWILQQLELDGLLSGSLAGLIHVNHQLRGAESDRDESFCLDLAARLRLPVEVTRIDVDAVARQTGRSLEATGREVRYRFFRDAALTMGATVVATGHTVDDQAETVLLRLLRGAGARGVGAIRVRRGRIIRPLLHVRRAELRAYLGERGAPFCEDTSNVNRSFARNRVRHDLLPVIEQIAPGGLAALARFAELSIADETYLQSVAIESAAGIVSFETGPFHSAGVQLDVGTLTRLPVAIGRRVVRLALEQGAQGLGFSLKNVQAVLNLANASRPVGHLDLAHLQAERRGDRLWLCRPVTAADTPFSRPLPLPGVVEVPEAGMTIAASVRDGLEGSELASGRGDVATVQGHPGAGPWVVRNRRPGDRLQPLGSPGHRKLHDLLIDRKIPREVRDRVPVIVDTAGQIVWVVGLTIAHSYRVTTPQTGVVVLEVRRNTG
jgi:tRNA(Ile)-lysidine synthase